MDSFFSWGLPLGRVAGIHVKLHWTLLLYWLYELDSLLRGVDSSHRGLALGVWATTVGLMFSSIFLHELGHCFAARRVGGSADEVLLWPLGGLAFCHCPEFPKSNLIVAAGGPAVTLAISAVSYAGFYLAGYDADRLWVEPTFLRLLLYQAWSILVHWNLVILIFNLIPLYPMDGGRIVHSVLWGFFSKRGGYVWEGHARASRITLSISVVTAGAGILYAIHAKEQMLLFLFFWALLQALSLRQQGQSF